METKMNEEVKDAGNVAIIEQARKDTLALISKLSAVIVSYMEEESIIPHNERFLVCSRAVNGHGVAWFNYFWRQFNPENKMEKTER